MMICYRTHIVISTMLKESEIGRIIEMAWEDRTPFEAILYNFKMSERDVIALMRKELRRSAFKVWRRRVQSRKTKHSALRDPSIMRFRCPSQNSRY